MGMPHVAINTHCAHCLRQFRESADFSERPQFIRNGPGILALNAGNLANENIAEENACRYPFAGNEFPRRLSLHRESFAPGSPRRELRSALRVR
jgi:hypothetical protein